MSLHQDRGCSLWFLVETEHKLHQTASSHSPDRWCATITCIWHCRCSLTCKIHLMILFSVFLHRFLTEVNTDIIGLFCANQQAAQISRSRWNEPCYRSTQKDIIQGAFAILPVLSALLIHSCRASSQAPFENRILDKKVCVYYRALLVSTSYFNETLR